MSFEEVQKRTKLLAEVSKLGKDYLDFRGTSASVLLVPNTENGVAVIKSIRKLLRKSGYRLETRGRGNNRVARGCAYPQDACEIKLADSFACYFKPTTSEAGFLGFGGCLAKLEMLGPIYCEHHNCKWKYCPHSKK